MKPQFTFEDIVRIRTTDPNDIAARLNGEEGRIAGMASNTLGIWSYAVFVYSQRECLVFEETELEPTGRVDEEARYGAKPHVRVHVDPVTGEGSLHPRIKH